MDIPIFVIGVFFIGVGYRTWIGLSWTWYLLASGEGLLGWYSAKSDVKDFFGIGDSHNES